MDTLKQKTFTSNLQNFTYENLKTKDNTISKFAKDPKNPTNLEVMHWAANAYKIMNKELI